MNVVSVRIRARECVLLKFFLGGVLVVFAASRWMWSGRQETNRLKFRQEGEEGQEDRGGTGRTGQEGQEGRTGGVWEGKGESQCNDKG